MGQIAVRLAGERSTLRMMIGGAVTVAAATTTTAQAGRGVMPERQSVSSHSCGGALEKKGGRQ